MQSDGSELIRSRRTVGFGDLIGSDIAGSDEPHLRQRISTSACLRVQSRIIPFGPHTSSSESGDRA
jgi:hypothetical protein